jgi:outer membrane protein assembly factor BamB
MCNTMQPTGAQWIRFGTPTASIRVSLSGQSMNKRHRLQSGGRLVMFAAVLATGMLRAEDWPMLGRDKTRNAVSPEKGAPVEWDAKTGRNIKWRAPLGYLAWADPVVAGGVVWVGTNRHSPPAPGAGEDTPVLKCFRETDGKAVWEFAVKPVNGLPRGDYLGFHSSPLIEGSRAWLTTRYGQVHCFDIGPLHQESAEPKPLWTLDMHQSLGVWPFYTVMSGGETCSIGASYRDRIYVITGNGITGYQKGGGYLEVVRSPHAPSLVCLDRNSGKVLWQDNSPGTDILCGQWGSPLVAELDGGCQVIAPMGDGWVRSFDALTGELLWKLNINLQSVTERLEKNLFLNAPVLCEGRVYIGGGRDIGENAGPGSLFCIDPTRRGDVSLELDDGPGKGKPNPNSAVVWHMASFGRTMAQVAVHDGLVIAAGLEGNIHCLDAQTGRQYWAHSTNGRVVTSPLIVDGKIYAGSDESEMFVFALSREKSLLFTGEFRGGIWSSPVFANGVLYLAVHGELLAIQSGTSSPPPPKPVKR